MIINRTIAVLDLDGTAAQFVAWPTVNDVGSSGNAVLRNKYANIAYSGAASAVYIKFVSNDDDSAASGSNYDIAFPISASSFTSVDFAISLNSTGVSVWCDDAVADLVLSVGTPA